MPHNNILTLVERLLGKGHFSGESNMSVRCPFHKGGEETRPSFSINVSNGLWHCFTCHASGPLPKLLKQLGVLNIDEELRDLKDDLEANRRELKWKRQTQWFSGDPFLAPTILPEHLLVPYAFCPLSLTEKGFDPQWLQWMDVGYDRNLKRIIYPIRDMYGNLAGVSGGATYPGQQPKYLVYQGQRRQHDTGKLQPSDYGEWFDEEYPDYLFHNHHYLWNFDSMYPTLFFGQEVQTLIIVEGFKACLWLLQHGWRNSVALMGSSMSDRQCSLLNRLQSNLVLFLDDDPPGRKATDWIARRLHRLGFSGVHIARYPSADKDQQPDDLKPDELAAALQGAETYPQWKRRVS